MPYRARPAPTPANARPLQWACTAKPPLALHAVRSRGSMRRTRAGVRGAEVALELGPQRGVEVHALGAGDNFSFKNDGKNRPVQVPVAIVPHEGRAAGARLRS